MEIFFCEYLPKGFKCMFCVIQLWENLEYFIFFFFRFFLLFFLNLLSLFSPSPIFLSYFFLSALLFLSICHFLFIHFFLSPHTIPFFQFSFLSFPIHFSLSPYSSSLHSCSLYLYFYPPILGISHYSCVPFYLCAPLPLFLCSTFIPVSPLSFFPHPSIFLLLHPFLCLFIHLSIFLLLHPFFCLFIHLSDNSSFRSPSNGN